MATSPAGNVAGSETTGDALITIEYDADAVALSESVTLITGVYVAGVVGVPEMIPDAPIVTPVGNAPLRMDHVYGPVPPTAVMVVVG